MKTVFTSCSFFAKRSIILLMLLYINSSVQAHVSYDSIRKKETVSVLSLDTKGLSLDPNQAGNLVRLELEKLEVYEVMDRYDVIYLIEKNKLKIDNCYGKLCLVEIGSTIHSDKMLTGTIELIGNNIIYSLRLIDVKTEVIVKSNVREFLNLPAELQNMTAITLREMFGFSSEKTLVERLSKKDNFEGAQNNPDETKLNLNGPRMGFTVLTGQQASLFRKPKEEGGFDGFPAMFQFGYQFEAQYLNEGNFQALFEFIPMITGLDQGRILPSVGIMNGFRDNRNGWEFAFGAVFYPIKTATGYYDGEGNWNLASARTDSASYAFPIVKRIDSRGTTSLTSGFVFAFGRTFKSGKLNIPLNGYVIPGKYGWRFGFSFGFNVKRTVNKPKDSWKFSDTFN